jgi:hypothetical protein
MYTGYAVLLPKTVSWVLSEDMMMGIIVAPGLSFSTASYEKYQRSSTIIQSVANLRAPPPFTGMHIVVHSDRLALIDIVLLWDHKKIRGEVRLPPKSADTF